MSGAEMAAQHSLARQSNSAVSCGVHWLQRAGAHAVISGNASTSWRLWELQPDDVVTAPRRAFKLANQLTMCTAGDFGMRGTPAYITPELLTLDAARNATQAVDVYSFGVSAAQVQPTNTPWSTLAAALAAWGFPLSDLPGLVPPALPRGAMPLVLWQTCPRVTYSPPPNRVEGCIQWYALWQIGLHSIILPLTLSVRSPKQPHTLTPCAFWVIYALNHAICCRRRCCYCCQVVMWEVWTFMGPSDVELPITLLAQRTQGEFGLPIPGTDSWREQQGPSPPEPAVGWSALMQQCLEAAASSRPTSAQLVTALRDMLSSVP